MSDLDKMLPADLLDRFQTSAETLGDFDCDPNERKAARNLIKSIRDELLRRLRITSDADPLNIRNVGR